MDEEKLYPLKQLCVRLKVTDGEALYAKEPISSPEKAAAAILKMLSGQDREYLCMCNLDSHCHPLNYHIISIGSISQCEVPVANVFKAAILSNASSFLLFHCHPSGDPSPSEADRQVTRSLIKAVSLMGIPLNDHLIVGCGTGAYYSFYEQENELFSISSQTFYQMTADIPSLGEPSADEKPSVLKNLKAPNRQEASTIRRHQSKRSQNMIR